MTDKQAKILYCVLAVPTICLIVWGSFWFVEKRDEWKAKSAIRATERRIKAKLPVKIYRGTYDGKEIEIRMYEPVR